MRALVAYYHAVEGRVIADIPYMITHVNNNEVSLKPYRNGVRTKLLDDTISSRCNGFQSRVGLTIGTARPASCRRCLAVRSSSVIRVRPVRGDLYPRKRA